MPQVSTCGVPASAPIAYTNAAERSAPLQRGLGGGAPIFYTSGLGRSPHLQHQERKVPQNAAGFNLHCRSKRPHLPNTNASERSASLQRGLGAGDPIFNTRSARWPKMPQVSTCAVAPNALISHTPAPLSGAPPFSGGLGAEPPSSTPAAWGRSPHLQHQQREVAKMPQVSTCGVAPSAPIFNTSAAPIFTQIAAGRSSAVAAPASAGASADASPAALPSIAPARPPPPPTALPGCFRPPDKTR